MVRDPSDFDLTFGRVWSPQAGLYDDSVTLDGDLTTPSGRLFDAFWAVPEFEAMIRRRMRTLADEWLAPHRIEPRLDAIESAISNEVTADRARWGFYGLPQTPAQATQLMIDEFIGPQYRELVLVPSGRVPPPQPARPDLAWGSRTDGSITLTNRSPRSVDISGFTIDGVPGCIPGGVVLNAGGSAIVVWATDPRPILAADTALPYGLIDGPVPLSPVLRSTRGEIVTPPPTGSTPVVTVSRTDFGDLGDGTATITVTGSGFDASTDLATVPPLPDGVPAGIHIVFGRFAPAWRPSDGAVLTPQRLLDQRWAVPTGSIDELPLGATVVPMAPDGSFSVTLEVRREATISGNYGVITYPGGRAVNVSHETFTAVGAAARSGAAADDDHIQLCAAARRTSSRRRRPNPSDLP